MECVRVIEATLGKAFGVVGGCITSSAALCDFVRSSATRSAWQKLRRKIDIAGVPYTANESHIVPVMVGNAKKCKWISDILLERYGIYIQPINYPTVPRGTERLRITPTPLHSDADIEHLVSALSELWSQCALSRAVA